MKSKIRNFRVSDELDLKLVESAHRLGADPSTYLRSLIEFGCALVLHEGLDASRSREESQ